MPPTNPPLVLRLSKSGSSVLVNVSYNSPKFTWIKAITVTLTGKGQSGGWTFREGDSQQGFCGGRSGLLDPGTGGALFVEVANVDWAESGTAVAACVPLSACESGKVKLK